MSPSNDLGVTADGETLASIIADVVVRLGGSGVTGLRRLTGGASRQTWKFVADDHPFILQVAVPDGVERAGLGAEAALLADAERMGVPVPRLVAVADTGTWIVTEFVEGDTEPRRVLASLQTSDDRRRLAHRCGEALGRIHRLRPAPRWPMSNVDQLDDYRRRFDAAGQPHPAFELAIRWLDSTRPEIRTDATVHGDFRLANLLVANSELRAVLDWELAHLGDPYEDIGWLTMRAWRFGGAAPVGGFGSIADFTAGYVEACGIVLELERIHWWQVLANLKWGVMSVLKANRHDPADPDTIELAATGRRICEIEHELLRLIA